MVSQGFSVEKSDFTPNWGHVVTVLSWRRYAPWAAAIFTAVISMIGSGNAAYWGDEAASVLSATRPLSTLWPMLMQVDAVHGLYYLFLHGWVAIFGTGEFATRFPSAIGVGIAAAGLWLLVSRLSGPRLAGLTVLCFAILPRVTVVGSEARGYAFAVAAVTWMVYGFMRLYQAYPRRQGWWWLWSLLTALACILFMYTALILLVIGVWLLIDRRRHALLRRTIIFGAIGILLASPLIVLAVLGQRGQVGFLATRPPGVEGVLVNQWFGNPIFAVLAWGLMIVAVGFAIRRWRVKGADRAVSATMFLALWVVVPPLTLALISIVAPSYSQRYVIICTPAIAALLALGIRELTRLFPKPHAAIAVAMVVVLACAALPSYLDQRGPTGKDHSDFRRIAQLIDAQAEPGDTVLFDSGLRNSRKPRLAFNLYPDSFDGLKDPGLLTPYAETTGLWDVLRPVPETTVSPESDGVWLAVARKGKAAKIALASLQQQGFTVSSTKKLHFTTVYHLQRTQP